MEASLSASSIANAAASPRPGITWLQVSSVMETFACPSISETIFGWTPLVNSSVAQVCLRSWKRMSGRPARRSRGLKCREHKLSVRGVAGAVGEHETAVGVPLGPVSLQGVRG